MRQSIFIALMLSWALPAWADSDDARNRVSFQVEASREVANDWATARLSVVAEGQDAAAVAKSVNQQMASALAIAKRSKGVEVESGAYVTTPVYDDGRVVRWRARQEIRAESGDVDRLAKLIGRLQGDSVHLAGIQFSVKAATRSAYEDELIEEALGAFRSRAMRIAKGLNEDSWSLISLSVGQRGGPPHVMQMRAESKTMSGSAPPVFEAGSSEIRVQVNGTIELD
jgi:predicted secreted protein